MESLFGKSEKSWMDALNFSFKIQNAVRRNNCVQKLFKRLDCLLVKEARLHFVKFNALFNNEKGIFNFVQTDVRLETCTSVMKV